MKVIIGLQARMSSTRLPGKVLMEVCNKPLLELMVERIRFSKACDDVVILTSEDPSDDPIEEFCISRGINYFRGDLFNVLSRFYYGCKKFNPEHVVRLTADCPLIDSEILDHVVDSHINSKSDYSANCIEYTYPDGLDVEVFTFKLLENTFLGATSSFDKEHVTPFMRKHAKNVLSVKNIIPYVGRWTVDYADDFKFVEVIFNHFYKSCENFLYEDIKKFLESNKGIKGINRRYSEQDYE